jgi:hypothetical protein
MQEEKIHSALNWIVSILERHEKHFQLTGGFAARAYGSPRPLTDIDLDVENGTFQSIQPELSDHILFGPGQAEAEDWSNFLMTLEFDGVKINLAESSTRIFDRQQSVWTEWPIDFSASSKLTLFGLVLPIIPRERLIAYKQVLGREQDEIDIAAMQKGA